VQAQALYTLRFYQAVDVRDLQLHGPQAAMVEMRSLGEPRVLEESRDDRRYRVTERRYAVTPFASGKLLLQGAYATGTVPAPDAMSPDERREVRLETGTQVVRVLPIPLQVGSADWLPARTLKLSEAWSSELQGARQGEALRRILRIEAHGIDAAQIPALEFAAEGFTVHAEPARIENRIEGDWNVGVREQGYRVVPLRPGRLTLPPMRLGWWNVSGGRQETAAIAARTLEVAAAVGLVPAPTPQSAAAVPLPRITQPVRESPLASLPMLGGLSALMLLLATWMLWRRRAAWRGVLAGCRRNDAAATRQALLQWAAGHWQSAPPRTLGEISARLEDAAGAAAIMELDRALYGPAGAAWQGRPLRMALAAWRPAQRRARPAVLPPLYPG
jgi:hypothetical protein